MVCSFGRRKYRCLDRQSAHGVDPEQTDRGNSDGCPFPGAPGSDCPRDGRMTIAWQYGRLKARGRPNACLRFSGNLGALAVSYPYEKIAKACQRALEFRRSVLLVCGEVF